MVEITSRLIFLILFIAGMAYFLYKDRDKIQRSSILFYRRTKNGIDKIDAIQKRFPRFWKAYGWGAAISGVLSMILAALYIGNQYVQVFKAGSIQKSGLSAVLPGLVSEASFQPGVSFIPVEYWIIGVGIVMTVHELSHGIVARSEDFEINSVGWIVLGIFPGAFVEPKGEKMLPAGEGEEEALQDEEEDEEESMGGGMWDQGSLSSRIKVLGAGSFANFLTALVFMVAAIGMTSAVSHPGEMFYLAQDGYPASQAGLTNGTLYSMNGEKINSTQEMIDLANNIQPGDEVTLNTSQGVYTITAAE
ncbi:MAG: site-2 protease family protein [Candidatus Nanohalobium sp.]